MVQTPERETDADLWARQQTRRQSQLWRGPLALTMHVGVSALHLLRLTYVIGAVARRAGLDCPELTERDVVIPALPSTLVGLRVGLISDFHIGKYFTPFQARRAIALLQSAKPDLIAMAGDVVDDRPRDTVPAAQTLAHLAAPLGVFGVLGNHDHRVRSGRFLAAVAEHAPNVRMLINAATPVTVGGEPLWIAGLDSAYLGLADPERALRHVPSGAPCLLLAHEPDVADHLPRPVTLALAGHAHGGQIRLGGRPLLLPPLGRRYHGGLRQTPSGPIYTSRGVGWTGLPLRLGCSPEVTVLRLTT